MGNQWEDALEEMSEISHMLPQAIEGEPLNVEHQALAVLIMVYEAINDLTVEIGRISERM